MMLCATRAALACAALSMTFAPDFASAQNTPYPFTPTEPAADCI
jgi:hypothetical protein